MHIDKTVIILNVGIIILVFTKIKGFYGMPTKTDERKQSKFLAPDILESDGEDQEDHPNSWLGISRGDELLEQKVGYPSRMPPSVVKDAGEEDIFTTSKTNLDVIKRSELPRSIPIRDETLEKSVPQSSSLPIFREIFQRDEAEESRSPVVRQPFSKDTEEEIPEVDEFFAPESTSPNEDERETSTSYGTNSNNVKESELPRSRPVNIGDKELNETPVIETSSPRGLPIFRQILQRGEAEESRSPVARRNLSHSPVSKGTEKEIPDVDELSGSETMRPEREKFNNTKTPEPPRSSPINIRDRGLNKTSVESIETSVPKSSSMPVFRQILLDEFPVSHSPFSKDIEKEIPYVEEFSRSETTSPERLFQPVSREFLTTEPGNVVQQEFKVPNLSTTPTEKHKTVEDKPTYPRTTTDHSPSISSHVSPFDVEDEEEEEEVVYQVPAKFLRSNQAVGPTQTQRMDFSSSAGTSSSVPRTLDERKGEVNIVQHKTNVDSLPPELPEFFRTKAADDDILLEELEVTPPHESIETEPPYSGSTPIFGQFSPQEKQQLDTQLPEFFRAGPTHLLEEELEPTNTNMKAHTPHSFASGVSPPRKGRPPPPQPVEANEDPLFAHLRELFNKPPDKTTKLEQSSRTHSHLGSYELFGSEPRARPVTVQQPEPPYSMYNAMSRERVLKSGQQAPLSGSAHQQNTQSWRREPNRIPSGNLHGIPANILEEHLIKQTLHPFNSRKPIVEPTPGNTEATRKTPTVTESKSSVNASENTTFQDKSKGIFSRPGFTFREFTPCKKENEVDHTSQAGSPPFDPLSKYRSRNIPSLRTDIEKNPITSQRPTAGNIFSSIDSIHKHMSQGIDGGLERRNFDLRAHKPQDVTNWNANVGISSSPKRQSEKPIFNNKGSPKEDFQEYQLFQSSNDLSKLLSAYRESSPGKDKNLYQISPDRDPNVAKNLKNIESLPRSASIFGRPSLRNDDKSQPTLKEYSLFGQPTQSYSERQIPQQRKHIEDVSTSQFVRQDAPAFEQTKQTGVHDTSSSTSLTKRSNDQNIDDISKRLQNNLTFQSFVRYWDAQVPNSTSEPHDIPSRDIFPVDFDNKSPTGRFNKAVSPKTKQTARLVNEPSAFQQTKPPTNEPEWVKKIVQYQPTSPKPERGKDHSVARMTENSPLETHGEALLRNLIAYHRGETSDRAFGAQQSYQNQTPFRNFLTEENKESVRYPSSPKNPSFLQPKMQQQKSSLSSMDLPVHLQPQQGPFMKTEQQTPVTLYNSPRTELPTASSIKPIDPNLFNQMAKRMFNPQPFITTKSPFNKPEESYKKTPPVVHSEKTFDISSYQERPKTQSATIFPEITSATFPSPRRYQLGQPETGSQKPKTDSSSSQVVQGLWKSPSSSDQEKNERKKSETISTNRSATVTSHSLPQAQNQAQPTNRQKDIISQPAPVRFPDTKPLTASSTSDPKDKLIKASPERQNEKKSVHIPSLLSSEERQELSSLRFGNFSPDGKLGEVSPPEPRPVWSGTGSRKELPVPTTSQNQSPTQKVDPSAANLVDMNWPALPPQKSSHEPIAKRIAERVPGRQPPQELDVGLRISAQHPFGGNLRKEEKKQKDTSYSKDEVVWPILPSKKDENIKFPTVIEDDTTSITFGSFPKQRSYKEIISQSKENALQETQIFPRSSSSRVQPVSLPKDYDLNTDKAQSTEVAEPSQTALSFSDIVRRNAGKAMAKIHGTKEKVALGRIMHLRKHRRTSKRDDTRANTSEIPPELCVLIIPKKRETKVDVFDEIRRLNLNFPLTKVKHYPSGSILVICRSTDEANRLQNAVQTSTNIRIKSKKVFPREVRINNLPKGVTEADIFRSIYQKFHENPNEVRLVDHYDQSGKVLFKAAEIVVNKALLKGIEDSPTVYIEGRNLDIDTTIRVPRCEKCKLLGHRANRCHNSYREYPSPNEPCIDCEYYNKFHWKDDFSQSTRNPKNHKTDAPNCLTKEYYQKKWERNQKFFDENEELAVEEEFHSGDKELPVDEEFYSAHSSQNPTDEFHSTSTHFEQRLQEDIENYSSDTNSSDDDVENETKYGRS